MESSKKNNRTVLDVGNCGPDHHSLQRMLTQNFQANVLQAHSLEATLEVLGSKSVDLVVINRKLDQDYSDGVDILKVLKNDPLFREIPVMLITNYEEHQAAAVALGAVPGFGKLSLNTPETQQRLASILN